MVCRVCVFVYTCVLWCVATLEQPTENITTNHPSTPTTQHATRNPTAALLADATAATGSGGALASFIRVLSPPLPLPAPSSTTSHGTEEPEPSTPLLLRLIRRLPPYGRLARTVLKAVKQLSFQEQALDRYCIYIHLSV